MTKVLEGTYDQLAQQLPLKSDSVLFIASDVKQIALEARKSGTLFDVSAFIESFQNVISEGTILVPAYTDLLKNGGVFDREKSKPTTGALSNKVFRRKDFIRTQDPLHSVFVWGNHSEDLKNLDGSSSLGEGSIFDWQFQQNGYMLCIDVHFQNSLTFVHYVEEKRKVRYRKPYRWHFTRILNGISSEKELIFYSRKDYVLTDLEALQEQAIEKGVATVYQWGNSQMLFFSLKEMHALIEEFLDKKQPLHRISLKHFTKTIAKKILGKN